MELIIFILIILGLFIFVSWKIIRIIKQELRLKYLNTERYRTRSGIFLVTKEYDKKYITREHLTMRYRSSRVDNQLENIVKYIIYNNDEFTDLISINNFIRFAGINDIPAECVGRSKLITDRVKKYIELIHKTYELCTLYNNQVGLNFLIQSSVCSKNITMKVYCFSYLEFKKLAKEFDWVSENFIDNNAAIISITNPKSDDEKLNDWTTEHPISRNWQEDLNKVLNISFHDDSEDFGPDEAKRIIDFIQANKGKDFYVHCIMGKSRSQAVCRFILDNFEGYVEGRPYENPIKTPNYHILSTLNRVFKYTV